jgi:carboxylesterase
MLEMSSMLTNKPFFLKGTPCKHHACLLLHGLGGGAYEMQLLGQYLNHKGWTVEAINYPGHEQASHEMPVSCWQQWYNCVEEAYLKLRGQYSTVSLVGFSTGCILGLHLANFYAVEKLVLLSPYISIKSQWYYLLSPEAYLFSVGKLISQVPRIRKPILDKDLRQHAQSVSFKSFNLSAVRSAIELIEIVKAELPNIYTPSLIIQSPKDSVVEPKGAVFIHENLGSSNKKIYWLQLSDHIITLDVEREIVFNQVEEFLDSKIDVVK